ncbi:hypothetical protein [Fibrella aquatica]|uniref:hypothetical protein n=1 Tax=Fibrella aquatica TaxID=3242487 RepID=UPI0035223C26
MMKQAAIITFTLFVASLITPKVRVSPTNAIIYRQTDLGSPILPIQSASWTATDALGRKLPTAAQTGPFKKNRYVGIFYFLWHGEHESKTIYDITKLTTLNRTQPSYGAPGVFHWWGEPEASYYKADDPWVIRRNLQMLTMAGVDVLFFDVTNASTYLSTVDKLCSISISMRHQGIPTPYFCFVTHTRATETITQLYQQIYQTGKYAELWFRWLGKPLMLGKSEEASNATIKDFFTWRYSWAWTEADKNPHHWQWLDNTPQKYGWDKSPEVAEQIPVAVAGHPTFNIGKSFRNGKPAALKTENVATTTSQGLYFDEQWKRALKVDPQLVFVTGWNEWIAQRFVTTRADETKFLGKSLPARQTYFIDLYNQEYNRDIEPMKGGYTDNYYYQLVANVRWYKGMNKPEKATPPKTIVIDGKFNDWLTVQPVYVDVQGDVIHRNHASFGNQINYINNTGRNDIIESRITYDKTNLYAYVRTSQPLTKSTDKNWMLFFIDSDQSFKTGWQGYDYVINKSVTNQKTTISQWKGKNYKQVALGQLRYTGTMLELSLPLSVLKINSKKMSINFHWADNIQRLYDINEFFINGDSAPDRRFNYVFNN